MLESRDYNYVEILPVLGIVECGPQGVRRAAVERRKTPVPESWGCRTMDFSTLLVGKYSE